jgi:hypothetical protein
MALSLRRRRRRSRPDALPPAHAGRGGGWGVAPTDSYQPLTNADRWIGRALALVLLAMVVTLIVVLTVYSV